MYDDTCTGNRHFFVAVVRDPVASWRAQLAHSSVRDKLLMSDYRVAKSVNVKPIRIASQKNPAIATILKI